MNLQLVGPGHSRREHAKFWTVACDVHIRRSPPIEWLESIHALRFWEFPCAAQDFGARAIELSPNFGDGLKDQAAA
jgi:hypothetical protein